VPLVSNFLSSSVNVFSTQRDRRRNRSFVPVLVQFFWFIFPPSLGTVRTSKLSRSLAPSLIATDPKSFCSLSAGYFVLALNIAFKKNRGGFRPCRVEELTPPRYGHSRTASATHAPFHHFLATFSFLLLYCFISGKKQNDTSTLRGAPVNSREILFSRTQNLLPYLPTSPATTRAIDISLCFPPLLN
jgi:hypothetical protein